MEPKKLKRIVSVAFACALAVPALTGALYAQDQGGGAPPPASPQAGGPDHPGGFRHKGNPAEHLKKYLGLTDAQAKQLADAIKAKWDAMKVPGKALRADMKTLREQVEKTASDQDIQATLNKLKQDREAMGAAMKDAEAKFEADTSFLSPTQRAKMLLGRMRMMRRRGHWRGGHEGRDHDGPPTMQGGGNPPPPAGQ
ncbi:MAG TPA: Spy/CpxP family protein refolding chaperone [Elusimicrobiota bacterium]|nr:Spy/CpxP family protein refolding chaperone [Elusimicrobiota bacterium]